MDKNAAALAVLINLGMAKEQPLTPEQEKMLNRALDPEQQYYDDILKVFAPSVSQLR